MTTLGKTPRSGPEGNTEPLDLPLSHRDRAWCYTYNNWKQHQPDAWDKIKLLGDYGCVAPEVGEEKGTPHLQGYFYFKNKKQKGALVKLFPKCSFRPAKGSALENRNYIFGPYDKDGKHKPFNPEAIEWGEIPNQGKRGDLDEIKNEIINGKKLDDIVMEQPILYHQYGRTLSKIEDLVMRKKWRTEMTEGIWYYGKTGVGKSHTAFLNFHPDTHYVHNVNADWWCRYTQQEIVIFNEFRGQIKFAEMLDLCDKYPKWVKRKNKEDMPFTSKKIIVTSALHPEQIYSQSLTKDDNMEQFYRRFKVIELKALEDEQELNSKGHA